jgi:hypothetical protein
LSSAAHALSFPTNPTRDAFVTTGPSGNLVGNNYGGAGSVSVAAPGLPQGEFQSVLQFDLADAAAAFDVAFGAGQWTIQSVTLQLTAANPNNAIFNTPAAGQVAVSWMQNDAWTEGTGNPSAPGASGITFTSLQTTFIGAGDQSLGAFAFSGATSGAFSHALPLTTGLAADVLAGSLASLRLFAGDTSVSALFHSRSFATTENRPLLTVVAVPEPDPLALSAFGLALLAARRRIPRSAPRDA